MTLSYNCTHALCTTCFNNWNFRSNTCPTCRAVSIYTNANNHVSHVQYNINDNYLINSDNNINNLDYDQLLNDLRNILNNNQMNNSIYEIIRDSINNLILQSDSSRRRNNNYNYNNINDLDNNINDLNYDQLISDLNYDQLISDLRNILNNNQMNNSIYEIIRDSINNLILQSDSYLRINSNYNYNNHTNSITEPNQRYGYNIGTNILIID